VERKRINLVVEVDLDPMPGAFYTPESAQRILQNYLLQAIGHYNPVVTLEEDSK
jgi:hypothetical protein